MNKNKYIVYLGYSGFPLGYAEVQKMIMVSKSLMLSDCKVTVINRKSVLKNSNKIPAKGNYEGIDYVYTTGTSVRPTGKLSNIIDSARGFIGLIMYMHKLKKQKKLDGAIISSQSLWLTLFYSILLKMMNVKSVLNYVEYKTINSSSENSWKFRIEIALYQKLVFKLVDKVMPISEFLIDVIKTNSPGSSYMKLPPICDFDFFKTFKKASGKDYFLFCGAISYWELIEFILDAFEKVSNDKVELYLVSGGSKELIKKLHERIEKHPKKHLIRHFHDIPYEELVNKYINAYSLLIPIRHTIKDIARYPHKISEYVASGRPIISTNEGEVKYQFNDGDTALLADKFDVDMYAEKMQQAVDNPDLVELIGKNAYKMGLKVYDYKAYSKQLRNLFN